MQNGFLPGQRRVSRDTSKEGGRRCEKTVPVCAARSSEGGKKRTAARWRTVITQEIKCRGAGCLARQLAEEARPLAERRVKYVDRRCHASAPDAMRNACRSPRTRCAQIPSSPANRSSRGSLLRTIDPRDGGVGRERGQVVERSLGISCRENFRIGEGFSRIFPNSDRPWSGLDLARVAAPLSLECITRSHSRDDRRLTVIPGDHQLTPAYVAAVNLSFLRVVRQ